MKSFISLILFLLILSSCSSDNEIYVDNPIPPVSPVVFDIHAVPYGTLSEYNFFDGNIAELQPVYGVLPYELITPLFTDYALKKRFVWMPDNESTVYTADNKILNFPVGSVLIKNFYYANVIPQNLTLLLETRLMIKKEEGWIFANYVWNEEQTEAVLDMEGSFVPVEWLQNGNTKSVNYRIPSEFECITCHKTGSTSVPIGPKPQNINSFFTFDEGPKNQLEKWVEMGYLQSGYPAISQTLVRWDDNAKPLEIRTRSYFDVNCAHCHMPEGHCDYRPLKLSFSESANPINLGICVEPEEDISFMVSADPSHLIYPGDNTKSVIYHRLNTTEESIKMPLMGRTLIHEEAVTLITQWINSMEPGCN